MQKKILTFLSLAVALLARFDGFAQGRLLWGVMASPSVEQAIDRDFVPDYDVRGYDDRLSYNFGVKGKLRLGGHFGVSSGLVVYNKGMRYTVHTTPNAIITCHIWVLSIPVTLDHQLRLTDKVALSSSAGVVFGKPVWRYYFQDYKDRHTYYDPGEAWRIPNINGGMVSLGLSCQIAKRVSLDIRPTYIRQVKMGWDKNRNARFDSYSLEVVAWYGFPGRHDP